MQGVGIKRSLFMLEKENRYMFMALVTGKVVSECGFDMSAYKNIKNYSHNIEKNINKIYLTCTKPLPLYNLNKYNIACQKLENITKVGSNDQYICIDNKTHLVEGLDQNFKKTGKLYNRFITKGDFFLLPTDRNTLTSNVDWNSIKFHYLYY